MIVRYFTFKLEDSLLQKLARLYFADIEQMVVPAGLLYSICEKKDEPATNVSDCIAVSLLPDNSDFDTDFFADFEYIEMHENLSPFKVLERKCSFQNLILTTVTPWNARIERTLIAFEQKNFEAIAELLYKSLAWDEFSTLPVAFLHLSKQYQPRMFATHELVCILLGRDPTNLLKLPEVQNVSVKRYFERESKQYEGIFVYAGEKPLLLEVLAEQFVHPDEITFVGNAKPPISIKTKQFQSMKNLIKFELPEIQQPEVIRDIKIDIEVKFQIYIDAEPDDRIDYEYIAFSQKTLRTIYDDLQNLISLKTHETEASTQLRFIAYKISVADDIFIFNRNFINLLRQNFPELLNSALHFRAISEKILAPHIMQFSPKPEPDWFDEEFQSKSASSNKILMLPDENLINVFFEFRTKKWHKIPNKMHQTLKSINLLVIDENWQSFKNLMYLLNPKLGKIITEQQNSAFDKIVPTKYSPEN